MKKFTVLILALGLLVSFSSFALADTQLSPNPNGNVVEDRSDKVDFENGVIITPNSF